MNILLQPMRTTGELDQRILLRQIGWDAYEKIVEGLAKRTSGLATTEGIKIMSPLPIHEAIAYWFGHFMQVLAEELDFPIRAIGGPTLRRRILDRGLEPDDCFYLASADKVVDWATLNLDRDPPPDLALEVEITCSCLDRMSVYAGLGVPEVLRFDGEEWHIHLLGSDRTYQESPSSAALPYLPVPEILPVMLQSLHVGDDRERRRIVRRWVSERVFPLREAWEQQQSPPPAANP